MIPQHIWQWWPLINAAADVHGVDAYLVAALMDRETQGGEAHGLDVPGPGGCGDRAPRKLSKYSSGPAALLVAPVPGKPLLCMPKDGRGWGRGLMQIDLGGHPEWCELGNGQPLWADPVANIDKGTDLFAEAYHHFQADGAVSEPELLAICAYNAGPGAAFHAYAQLTQPADSTAVLRALDAITEGGNYVSDVLRRRSEFLQSSTP